MPYQQIAARYGELNPTIKYHIVTKDCIVMHTIIILKLTLALYLVP